MRIGTTAGLTVLFMLLMAVPGSGADVANVTCRLEAAADHGAVAATVCCLQLDTETYGEFRGSVTVILQVRTRDARDGWVSVARQACTGSSLNGVMELSCSATAPRYADSDVRGLIDLNAPLDWRPVVADPTYVGGAPPRD
jgi:hypothetical protein